MTCRSLATATIVGLCSLTLYAQKPTRAGRPVAPAPRTERAVPFRIGETLTYDVSWSSYVTAGTAIATVKEKKPSFGSTAYYIVAEGRPTPLVASLYTLYYKLDTLLDTYTLLPQRGSVYTEEGRRHKYTVAQFDRQAQQVSFEAQSATRVKTSIRTPPGAQDALSAFYALRTMPFKTGGRTTVPVVDDGNVYRLVVDVERRERVATPIGDVAAWRLRLAILDPEGQPQGKNIAVWISEDARRLPLKMQAELAVGSFQLTLRSAT